TADCPLADPHVADRMVEVYLANKYDYVANVLRPTYPAGFEVQVFAVALLAEVATLTSDPTDHEHVSLYIYEHPERYRLHNIDSAFADDPGFATAGVCTHAQAYAQCEATQLVAICDKDAAKLERCGQRWHVAARYRDAGRLLAEEQPQIVSVCTPDHTHYEL